MSIYASNLTFDHDWGDDTPPPIVYRGSHRWPDPDDRGGNLDVAAIPGFVHRNGQVLDEDGERVWPWLRVALTGAADDENRDTVLLDRNQVRLLRDELTDWLGRAGEAS